MQKSARSKAEEKFAASETKAANFLKGKEKARQESAARNAKLRGLRLAKEEAEKLAAEKAAAAKPPVKSRKKAAPAAD